VTDAIVIGSGPNGLVAANLLADHGWAVEVLEAEPDPGGAVRSGELTLPGFVHDRFSSFYPLAAASPAIGGLRLEEHGLRWRRHPLPVAHPRRDGSAAIIDPDPAATVAAMDAFAPGDGEAWRRLMERWDRVGEHVIRALFTPFPPLRAGLGIASELGYKALLDLARFALLPVRRFADEEFRGDGGPRMIAGNALHADFSPEQSGGAMFGWVLCALAQTVGFPIPEGGSGELTRALVRRLEARGGRVVCGARVRSIEVRRGRAVAVRTEQGDVVTARRAILARRRRPAALPRAARPCACAAAGAARPRPLRVRPLDLQGRLRS
jgi:phytoene dehydrogenase-like protein